MESNTTKKDITHKVADEIIKHLAKELELKNIDLVGCAEGLALVYAKVREWQVEKVGKWDKAHQEAMAHHKKALVDLRLIEGVKFVPDDHQPKGIEDHSLEFKETGAGLH